MKEELKEFCMSLGIEHVGIAHPGPYYELAERWSRRVEQGLVTGFEEKDFHKRIYPRLTLDDVSSVIVCLFPYHAGSQEDANLSRSAWSLDYHSLVKAKLNRIGEYLSERISGFHYKAFVDDGPLVDRYLAYMAGLGYFGINSHIITDKYGSYVFIGYILNNYPFQADQPLDKTCRQCGKCVSSCPGGAILGDFDINPLRCRSYITQKKGDLTTEEMSMLQKDRLIFGCDICQEVCPHNTEAVLTPLEEFRNGVKHRLDTEELKEISNKEFLRRYRDRAFSWRGKGLLLRNIEAINSKDCEK